MKRKKLLLFSLLFSTSIVYPLTSCGSDGLSNDIGGFDKEFGFDAQTYNRLENEFINKYRNQLLDDNNIDKNVAFDKYDNFLQNDITSIRNQLFDPVKNYSFTIRTNTLMDYASKNYNIYLNRNIDVSETDFSNLKQSSLENFVIYLDNIYGIENNKKEEQITNFSTRFDQLLLEITSEYHDKAEVLMRLRASVIDCWQDLNQEFALLSAYNHLKDFFNDYDFIVKDQSDKLIDNNKLLWNNLLDNEQFITNDKTNQIDHDINCPISDRWINELFTIAKKKNYTEADSSNQQNDSTSEILPGYKEIKYFNSQEIIPGYSLTPVLKTMSQDIYANEYYMSIDWQLISNKYKDETNQEIKNNVTAHIVYNKDGQIVKNDDFKNGQLSSDNYQFTKYSLFATPTYQSDILDKAYFDNEKEKQQKITFSWDEQKIGIEYFLPSDAYNDGDFVALDDPYNLTIAQDNLSKIGLKLNGTNLSDLLVRQNKSQDNQFSNNTNNSDADLKIEEKFVKYCTINAISTVTFDNNQKNNIKNIFIINYSNANQECEVIEKQIEAELNDIGPSSTFNDNAIYFYNSVANYIDTKKIVSNIKASDATSNNIYIELIATSVLLVLFLFLIFYEISIPKYPHNPWNKKLPYPFITFIFLVATTIGLFIFWHRTVYKPIHNQVDKVKEWNNEINGDSSSKISIIKKVNSNDKEHFKSSDYFNKYFCDNPTEAISSYFYYFHFYNLLQASNKIVNYESDISKQVKDDFNEFNDSKIAHNVTIDIDRFKILRNVLVAINMIVVIIACFAIMVDVYVIKAFHNNIVNLDKFIDLRTKLNKSY